MRIADLTGSCLLGLLASGIALGACSGSATTANADDAGSTGLQGDGASDDATGGGGDGSEADGSGSQSGDASHGHDAQGASSGRDGAAADGTSPVDGASGGDGAAGVQCGPGGTHSFPTFDKHCSGDPDCVLAVHTLSCCGNVLVMGINKNALTAFQAAESTCNAQYPACGCASNNVSFDDGVAYYDVSNPTQAAAAKCTSGSCQATFTGATFPCGGVVCASGVNYCQMQASDAGAPSSQCVFTGPPTNDAGLTCSSFAISPGCTCTETQGNPTVTCP